MEKRLAGEIPTLETRAEAEATVDKQKRYKQIIECFNDAEKLNGKPIGLTAKQVAVMMMKKGFIPTSERNFAAPRLTEMSQKGVVEPIGKKKCNYTGKTVAVYALRKDHYGTDA